MQNSENKGIVRIRKSHLKFLVVLLALFLVVLLFRGYNQNTSYETDNSPAVSEKISPSTAYSDDVQIVKLKVVAGQYVIEPSSFRVGVPVVIEADISEMPGCSKSIVIPAFDIRKSLSSRDNKIEFTPDKSGTFNIACSMNMYKGTFTVLDSNGSKGNYVEPKAAVGASCGGTSGGCGCGG